MKYKQIKGVILQNLLYLVMFFIVYFIMVFLGFYTKDQICAVDIIKTYCDNIPASTTTTLNFLIYGIVPIGAIIWAIWSMSTPSYREYR